MAWTDRTRLILGEEGLSRLSSSRVVVVGIGGVGAYAAEMLVRSGLGHIVLVDSDEVSESNLNRQLIALHSTLGRPKTDVLRERLLDINPALDVVCIQEFLSEDNLHEVLDAYAIDCLVDAIDTLAPKVSLVKYCVERAVPLVSSMGSGGKLDATAIRATDISKTYQCPLARALRRNLHKEGINSGFTAVFSPETPLEGATVQEDSRNKRSQVGTVSYLPAVFGCVCAQAVICRIAGIEVNS